MKTPPRPGPTPGFRFPFVPAPLLLALALAGCASYDNAKGKLHLQMDQPVEGVQSLESAARKAPTDAGFKLDYLHSREDAVKDIMARANTLRAEGKLADARLLYEQVLKLDRGNARAQAALAALPQDLRYERLLTEGEKFLAQGKVDLALDRATQVLEDHPRNRHALTLKEAAADAKAQAEQDQTRAQAARSVLEKPVTLQFNDAPIKVVFEALSRSVGLNILIDRDVKPATKVSIFVKDIAVADAIDFILLQNQLEKRVVNGNTLMIYPLTDTKKAEYEDLSIRSFQVTNADTKYLSTMLKSMLKLRDISADERTGILVIRDTPERLRLAAKLIAVHDTPDPEIMLEVEILEVTSTRTSSIGVQPPTSLTFSTPSGLTAFTWGDLRALRSDDLLVSPLTATVNFKLEDGNAKLLAGPRIRARNKEKAKILIGDRVPTITNTVTPIATGSSVVTGSVSYQDVGLKLEFEPQVYANDEVGIRIALEVSNIAAEFTDRQGGRSYQIGTRNAVTNLRLKDGETQVLGGLISEQDRNTASKIPGLGHLPVIGRIFGNNEGTGVRSEIVLAITPRIVRNLPSHSPDVKNIFSGTFNVPRERPILAEPVTMLKAGASIGGSTNNAAVGNTATGEGAAVVAPNAPAQLPAAPPAAALPVPPAMFVRPPPTPPRS
jgi:general secretion pathway protein D